MKNASLKPLIILSLLALVLGGVFAFAADDRNYSTEPASFSISNIPLKIMAERKVSAPLWVYGRTYKHGDMVRSTSNTSRVYWNVSMITNLAASYNEPTHAWGDVADGTTNVWRRVMPRSRLGYSVQNEGTCRVWFTMGHNAETNAGFHLDPGGSHWIDNDSMQDWMSAVSTNVAVTNRIVTQEW